MHIAYAICLRCANTIFNVLLFRLRYTRSRNLESVLTSTECWREALRCWMRLSRHSRSLSTATNKSRFQSSSSPTRSTGTSTKPRSFQAGSESRHTYDTYVFLYAAIRVDSISSFYSPPERAGFTYFIPMTPCPSVAPGRRNIQPLQKLH